MLHEDFALTPDLGRMAIETRFLITIGVLIGGWLLRKAVVRLIHGPSDVISDDRRWWMVTTRNVLTVAIVISLLALWAPEIGDFALSITAFIVALVIATKELILCISGAAWASVTRPFDVGDWVEIGGHSGEVVDATMMGTVLQEIEPREFRYTGRTIAVPNSQLLTQPVVNHNFRKRFLHHEFVLHTAAGADAPAVRDAIAAALAAEAEDFAELARRYVGVIEKRAGVKLPDVAPTVRVQTNPLANVEYRCSLFCPRERAVDIEQAAAGAMFGALAAGAAADRAAAQ